MFDNIFVFGYEICSKTAEVFSRQKTFLKVKILRNIC